MPVVSPGKPCRCSYGPSANWTGRSSSTGSTGAQRWDESPKIAAVAPDGAVAVVPDGASSTWDGPSVLLARLAVSDNGDVTVDGTAVRKAGLSVPGEVGIGSTGSLAKLSVGASNTHLELLREKTEKVGGSQLYLDLVQRDPGGGNVPEVSPTIRFRHQDRFSKRIEGRASGFHFLGDQPSGTDYADIKARNIFATGSLEVTGKGGTNVDMVVNGRLRSNNNDGGLWVSTDRFVGGHATNQIGFYNGDWRLTVQPDGNVGVGTVTPPGFRLTVNAATEHVQIRREISATLPSDGTRPLYLELLQEDISPPGVSEVAPSIRFHHRFRFWHRLEAQTDGFHLKIGDMKSEQYSNLQAGMITSSGLRIGSVTIGEYELSILQKLAAGNLRFDLYNTYQHEYAFAGINTFDAQRRYVLTATDKGTHENGVWQIVAPR
jgi:hypothetical protein